MVPEQVLEGWLIVATEVELTRMVKEDTVVVGLVGGEVEDGVAVGEALGVEVVEDELAVGSIINHIKVQVKTARTAGVEACRAVVDKHLSRDRTLSTEKVGKF